MSIKPEFADKIISGEKKYEYRRRLCSQPIDCLYLYATKPVKKIVAKAIVCETLFGEKEWVWNQTKDFGGIEKSYFDCYFDGRTQAGAYCLGRIDVYDRPRELREIGILTAPQSFIYLSEEQVMNL